VPKLIEIRPVIHAEFTAEHPDRLGTAQWQIISDSKRSLTFRARYLQDESQHLMEHRWQERARVHMSGPVPHLTTQAEGIPIKALRKLLDVAESMTPTRDRDNLPTAWDRLLGGNDG
jgi:hypothetical protein